MKNSEVKSLKQALDNVSDLSGVRFSYKVSQNLRILGNQSEDLDAAIAPTEGYQKFLSEKQELLAKYADKDENDKPKTKQLENGQGFEYIISSDNMTKYERAFNKLKTTHKEAIEYREKQETDYAKLLGEEFEDAEKLKKFHVDDLPESITFGQLFLMYRLIENNTPKTKVTLTNQEIRNFSSSVLNFFNEKSLDFILPIIGNYYELNDIIDEISEKMTWSAEYNEYNTKRVNLASEYAKVDDDGKPVIVRDAAGTNSFAIDDQKAFSKALERLKSEYREAIETQEKRSEELLSFLKDEREVSLSKLTFDDLIESITANQLKSISFMINDDE